MFQEFPKWVHGPDGKSVVVANYEDEIAQLADWFASDESCAEDEAPEEIAEADAPVAQEAPKRRGRPPKVKAD